MTNPVGFRRLKPGLRTRRKLFKMCHGDTEDTEADVPSLLPQLALSSELRAPCSLPRSRGLAVWRESLFSAPMPGLTSCLDRQAGDS